MNFLLHQHQLDFLLHMHQHLSSSLSRFLVPWFRISAPVPGNLARLGMVLKTLSTCISFSGNLSFTCAMMMLTKLSLIPLKRFFCARLKPSTLVPLCSQSFVSMWESSSSKCSPGFSFMSLIVNTVASGIDCIWPMSIMSFWKTLLHLLITPSPSRRKQVVAIKIKDFIF